MMHKRVLVTVGTTKFDKLLGTVTKADILTKLRSLGYNKIHFQTGASAVEKINVPEMTITYTEYMENFIEEIQRSHLVISHAGAGTCLDVLKNGKPLIVVVNDELMDNHQLELAEQLQNEGHLFYCICDNLMETLNKDVDQLTSYPKADVLFSSYLDKCMGFV